MGLRTEQETNTETLKINKEADNTGMNTVWTRVRKRMFTEKQKLKIPWLWGSCQGVGGVEDGRRRKNVSATMPAKRRQHQRHRGGQLLVAALWRRARCGTKRSHKGGSGEGLGTMGSGLLGVDVDGLGLGRTWLGYIERQMEIPLKNAVSFPFL